jgi:integrase
MKIYLNGKPIVRKTGKTSKREAMRYAKKIEAEMLRGGKPIEYGDVTYDNLIENLVNHYRVNQKKSLSRLYRSLKFLNEYFEGSKAQDISGLQVKRYVLHRQEMKKVNGEPYAPATINRELAALKTAFRLAFKEKMIGDRPYIQLLPENNIKEGHITSEQLQDLINFLPAYIKPFIEFCYLTGMRKEEAINLTWNRNVSLREQTLMLSGADTKNGEPRVIPLEGAVAEIVRVQHVRWGELADKGLPCEYVFPNRKGTGKIKEFRSVWCTACRKADLGYGYKLNTKYVNKWKDQFGPGPVLHDLRRSFVTKMIEAGESEKVIQKLGGWRSNSVFKRYQVVRQDHLRKALLNRDAFLAGEKQERKDKV